MHEPLLNPEPEPAFAAQPLPRDLTLRLYTSHFLSTWNSRLFEFGAVLFLADIFPDTLLPMSVYALVRSGAAIVFARRIGEFIDHGDRLRVLRVSIVGQRVAVALSCVLFLAMQWGGEGVKATFPALVVLACVERLGAMMNLIAVERDWVVVMTEGNDEGRRVLNARMRRIDLLCKLLGPLAISGVAAVSIPAAIVVTLGTNVLSVGMEYPFIARVYRMVPALQRNPVDMEAVEEPDTSVVESRPVSSLMFYLRHPAFLPSLSLSILYLTVLSFSGQMITYLISVGYTSWHVGLARTISTVFELSATWIAPKLMGRIGVVRAGIWNLSWQMIWLTVGVTWFLSDGYGNYKSPFLSATGLAVGVALSRIGLWGYDLCAQNIIQDEVETDHRGAFSTVETSFQNLFEMLSYLTTVVFSRPEDFRWPALISVGAIYVSGALYAAFVRKRRGHLFHAPPASCICVKREERDTDED
ncbi:hypothetical protein OQA88_7476 [Cercophora sp. LCS_1]